MYCRALKRGLLLGSILALSCQPIAQSQALRQKVHAANADINNFWIQKFRSFNREWRTPRAFEYTSRAQTPCGMAQRFNALYCGLNHSIYLNIPLLVHVSQRLGDFAAITILAHEYGHAAQRQLGLSRLHQYLVQEELQADCFAGAYARDASRRGLLRPQDAQHGYLQSYASGHLRFHAQTHGTRDQRARAYYLGYSRGFASCLAYSRLQ
ncbi:zinc metalloprotease [Synechococcales cyanobacterium C]|uniref:Zinc metalloprotease n=1 Tax=Petrachloros mirabilis ULC683 TaxID=2781853 RepID=A0A8K2A0V2_9CYAN|nr:neutral zinc metallopeptidase [Petrachloros mirabilis]NCJ07538.1 zinc metalloprotease [Petrachloros mirabilis ULC683]